MTTSGKRPFWVEYHAHDVEQVKERLARDLARIPLQQNAKEGESTWKQGTNYDFLQTAIMYWLEKFDWKSVVDSLNAFKNYKVDVEGLDIHFIEQRSPDKDAIPLLLLHGWPGSVYEFRHIIPMLTDAKDGTSFHVVAPSMPGYGWSEAPKDEGVNVFVVAKIVNTLMEKLGYTQYIVQGGDWGGIVARAVGALYPQNCVAIHTNFAVGAPQKVSFSSITPSLHGLLAPAFALVHTLRIAGTAILIATGALGGRALVDSSGDTEGTTTSHQQQPRALSDKEKLARTKQFLGEGSAYQNIQATRPATLGAALNSSPVALLSWLLEKFHAWSGSADGDPFSFNRRGQPMTLGDALRGEASELTVDDVIAHAMIYWTTGTITSSIRFYYESMPKTPGKPGCIVPGYVPLPTAIAVFPDEVVQVPRALARFFYNVVQYTEFQAGGHFAALERPRELVQDIQQFCFRAISFKDLAAAATQLPPQANAGEDGLWHPTSDESPRDRYAAITKQALKCNKGAPVDHVDWAILAGLVAALAYVIATVMF